MSKKQQTFNFFLYIVVQIWMRWDDLTEEGQRKQFGGVEGGEWEEGVCVGQEGGWVGEVSGGGKGRVWWSFFRR